MDVINVLVTGVGGGGVGEQILKCLKLSALDYYIVGCDISETSKGLKLVDVAYIVPPASDEKYIETIVELCKKHQCQIIFPGSEPELKVISKHRNDFVNKGICVPLNSQTVIDICMDKNRTIKFLKDNGFEIQKFWEINSENDLMKIDIFPVVIKPSLGGGGSVNTFIAQDKDELLTFGKYLLGIYKTFTAQEYVGDAEHEYTVGVYMNADGEYVNSIAVKKYILSGLSNKIKVSNRTGRKELGKILAISSGISQGEISRFPDVTEPSKQIALALGATAPINIQCRIHNGKMYVFEINPRISGTSSIRAIVGYNEPELLVRERLLGETIRKDFNYVSGYVTRGLDETFVDDSVNNTHDTNMNLFLTARHKKIAFNEHPQCNNMLCNYFILGDVELGKNSDIGMNSILDGRGAKLKIGDFVSIDSGVMIYTHDSTDYYLRGGGIFQKGSVVIGSNTVICTMSIISCGVSIGHHCIIGANSFVNKDIPDYSIAAGNPAKVIGEVRIKENGDIERFYY